MALAVIAGVAWSVLPTSMRVIEVTDFSAPTEASVRAPIRPLGSGAMYVLYEGALSSSATLTVLSNHRRDKHEIELKPGQVHGIFGGAEEWVDDLSVVFTPSGTERGKLKIGLYCGSGFSKEDWEWYNRINGR